MIWRLVDAHRQADIMLHAYVILHDTHCARCVTRRWQCGSVNIWQENYEVYGARKVWRQMLREGQAMARCKMERLMRAMRLCGVTRGKTVKTTQALSEQANSRHLVKRHYTTERPNQLWVVDFTFVSTWQGFAYVAFIEDVYSRFIVG